MCRLQAGLCNLALGIEPERLAEAIDCRTFTASGQERESGQGMRLGAVRRSRERLLRRLLPTRSSLRHRQGVRAEAERGLRIGLERERLLRGGQRVSPASAIDQDRREQRVVVRVLGIETYRLGRRRPGVVQALEQ